MSVHFTSEVVSWQWTTAAGQHSLRLDRRQAIELFLAAPLVLAVGSGSETTVDEVLADMPVVLDISQSIMVIMSTVFPLTPAVVTPTVAYLGQLTGNLKLVETLLEQYRQHLDRAPGLDTALATVMGDLGLLVSSVTVYGPDLQAAVGVAAGTIQSIILAVVGLIPAGAAQMFPQTSAAIRGKGAMFGRAKQIPGPRSLARQYNAGVRPNYPEARVPVPGFWIFP